MQNKNGPVNDVIVLNTENWGWAYLEPVPGCSQPPKRHSHTAIFWKELYLVVFGGVDAEHKSLNDVWMFHLTNRQWTRQTTQGIPPSPRQCHTMTLLMFNKCLIYGGFDLPPSKKGQVFDEAFILDLDNMTWQDLARTEYCRCCHTATFVPPGFPPKINGVTPNGYNTVSNLENGSGKGKVYVFFGAGSDCFKTSVLCIDAETGGTTEIQPPPESNISKPPERVGHASCCVVNATEGNLSMDIYTFGGMNPFSELNDIAVWRV
eukprot:jgi/Botrbrau1/17190/Bobra.0157s0080.1